MLSVYIAGASDELERCKSVIQQARRVPGLRVTLDWTLSIDFYGGADQRPDSEREANAQLDFDAIERADMLWLLLPETHSKGVWAELGYAVRLRRVRQFEIIVSRQDESLQEGRLPLFVTLADEIYPTDRSAFAYLRSLL